MKKFLVVGVGGSGGATIRYVMDQLAADLRAKDVHRLPAAWQFVHIDVNPVPESTPGLGDIRKLGGRYVAVSSSNNTFDGVRRTVEGRLQADGRLDGLLGCNPLPRDQAANVPVVTGAGQYRAIGRMLTLTRLDDIQSQLNQAWADLRDSEAWGDLATAPSLEAEGPFDNAGAVVPIVIGSMAGGSGASMCLDVCRVLGRITGLERRQLGLFLFTPDVFASLDPSKRKGIDGNALAALGELIAAQVRVGDRSDNDLLVSLGLAREPENQRAFGRVFPIGSFIGGDGAKFGARADDVFRGLGRAIAATMLSDTASQQYLQTRFENSNPPTDGQDLLGWGADSAEVSWGAFGYSSLSLGRDRYADYAAQRLARTVVDRLVDGYRNPASPLPPTEQLDQLVANQWPVILDRLGLAAPEIRASEWLRSGPLPDGKQREVAHRIATKAERIVDQTHAQNTAQWLANVQRALPDQEQDAAREVDKAAYAWAEKFAADLERRTRTEVLRILAHPRQGLPYARKVLEKLAQDVRKLAEKLALAPASPKVLVVDTQAAALAAQVELSEEVRERVKNSLRNSTQAAYGAGCARRAAGLLESFSEDVVPALHRSLSHALENLDKAMKDTTTEAGLAQLYTTIYNEWPEATEHVPARFGRAQNEVLLTTADGFPAKFREHVQASLTDQNYEGALDVMVEQIVRGVWDNVGAERSDFTVIEADVTWRPAELPIDAASESPTPENKPTYTLALSPKDILDRAYAYQARKDQPFAVFSTQSFEGYLDEFGISDSVRAQRRSELTQKFEVALQQAFPLVGVSPQMVEELHKDKFQIELSFSTVPLTPSSPAAEELRALLKRTKDLESQTHDRFKESLRASDSSSRIAIYGSYPKYFPLVFSSFLSQLKDRWAGETEAGKVELWKWKRTRALPAAIAMSGNEQLAMVKGWYLGRALGLIHQPGSSLSAEPVSVYDLEKKAWLAFPDRLLTARSLYRDPHGYDWLPGVLEGHVLAIVDTVNDQLFQSLQPYRALRRIHDTDPLRPTEGPWTNGDQLIADWLRTGVWPSGEESPISSLRAAAADPESRASALTAWIVSLRDHIERNYLTLPTGPGESGERHLRVPTTDVLDGASLFTEIALLVHVALGQLLTNVDRALGRVAPQGGAHAAPEV